VSGAGRSLILASRSPQRSAILGQLGIAFTVVPAEVEELTAGPPHEVVAENAYRKAATAAAGAEYADALVLGVDTIVSLGSAIYGKPVDADAAGETLRALSGRRHTVLSGVCLIEHGRARTAVDATTVEFRQLGEELISWYLKTGEWQDRAGGYAIQGRGAALVARIEGDYLNVVGLPVSTLLELAPGLLGV
jgi:septum formation protein